MPDDEIAVLVWSTHLDDARMAHHDSGELEKWGDSGWIEVGTSRVVLGVTHYCAEVLPPVGVAVPQQIETEERRRRRVVWLASSVATQSRFH
jgi:hypothetical protein